MLELMTGLMIGRIRLSSDLSGGITQVLNQNDNYQREVAVHKMTAKENFEAFNSKCVVMMGSVSDLDKEQGSSCELFRSNGQDVEILTSDELLWHFKKFKN